MEDMNRLSLCKVGLLKRRGGCFMEPYSCSRSSRGGSSPSLWSSPDSRMIVHPGGDMELWILRSLRLKARPAKTGETVIVWPLGR